MRQFILIFLIIFISLSIGFGQEQPKLRQGHAQTPEAAKEELVQFKETYGDLAGWKLRKKRICDGIILSFSFELVFCQPFLSILSVFF